MNYNIITIYITTPTTACILVLPKSLSPMATNYSNKCQFIKKENPCDTLNMLVGLKYVL